MKRFTAIIATLTVALLFLVACNGKEEKNEPETHSNNITSATENGGSDMNHEENTENNTLVVCG